MTPTALRERSAGAAGAPAHPTGHSLGAWFERGMAVAPDAEALRVGNRHLTYRQVHDEALALAGALTSAVRGRPRRVGLLAARSVRAYTGLLAATFAGAAVVPLNPAFPPARTAAMIEAAGVDVVIVDDDGAARLPDLAHTLAGVPVVDAPADTPAPGPHPADPDEIAYILFTSGSTGRPKGVPVLHRNVDAYLRFVHDRYGFGPGDVFSQTFDLTFDLAMFDLFAGWGSGGTVVSVPQAAYAGLERFLTEQGVTVWFSAPSLIALARRRGLDEDAMPTLRWSLFCGEPLLDRDAADWQRAAPHSVVENLYGPTELTISCSVHRWDPDTSPARAVNGVVPIGALHPGMSSILLDVDEATGAGELCVTGHQMFPGYLDPADDEGRFVSWGGNRWYRTGDLVRWVDGDELVHLGRRDHQVQVHGVRVELAEVEWGLREVEGVDDAVVVAVDGELVAYWQGAPSTAAALAARLADVLPKALVPRRFVKVDDFPLNANRKIDRKALAARAAGPVTA
ncbi:AMP-binding protein [Streptomyces sp. ICBB 8177]|uniref:AMP-binding protein n=1 Tax=Streptomyces sp. ICBB 8177 TaxID=563922 RepID=UPI000D6756A0|nr:AMP-binding protein [Streptomyces sp. ICBB 8177]PWI44828.1 D-alanine--poly(phosphoribitol) ligase [Streptomyces sp. ICBB 8177]